MGALALLVLAIVATMGGLAERGLRHRVLTRIDRSLQERASLVREVLRGQHAGGIVELDALADRAAGVAHARVTLIERDGTVVGDSDVPTERILGLPNHADRPEIVIAQSGLVGRSVRTSTTVRRPLSYLALPADEESGNRIVRMAVDLEELDGAVAELRLELFLAGALGLAAALLVSFGITRLILRPVEELRTAVNDIADGRLERRVEWDSRDELGEIGESINRVTEQLRVRLDEATAEKTRLEAVLRSMVEGVLVLDATGHVSLANPRLQELLDVWSDPVGKAPLDLLRNLTIDDALAEASRSGEPQVREIEIGPRTLRMHAVAVPPVGAGGSVAVFHDVSEVRKLEQVRRDFLANASHELRTPLTSIQGFATTLMQDDLPDDDRRHFTEVVARNAERLGNLLDDLLELSQLEGRREPLTTSEVDVAHIAQELLDDLGPRLEQQSLAAEIHVGDATRAWGDRRAVEQILTNLIDNALKYTDEGGRIDVTLRGQDGRLEVVVADTGLGIPADEVPRVFERFYRVDKARSRALGGTGLGLAIVKHLVQAMGGDIRLESEVGEGSRFTFWLPATPPSA
jgi:two-component system phosphate regulon sensor histidine kinase PhoR